MAFAPSLYTLNSGKAELLPLNSFAHKINPLDHKTLLRSKHLSNPILRKPLEMRSSDQEKASLGSNLRKNLFLRSLLTLGAMSVVLHGGSADASPTYVAWAKAPPTYIHRATGRLHRWDSYDNSKRDWYSNHDALFEEKQEATTEWQKFARDKTYKKSAHGYSGDRLLPVIASVFCGVMAFSVGSFLKSDVDYDPFERARWKSLKAMKDYDPLERKPLD
eukprot:2759000-Rhodomonas_salina.1